MGSILSSIRDDIQEYVDLCKRLDEKVQFMTTAQGTRLPDAYGQHAKSRMARAEEKTKDQKPV